jgi:hypothetical protein
LIGPVAWMAGVSLAGWLAASAAAPVNPEAFFGMLGPLASAVATWVVVRRTYTAAPERLTGVMVVGFGVKLLFFGMYLVAMLRGLGLRPTVFVVSFAGFFIALHVIEALFLKRLFVEGSHAAPRV